MRDLKRRVESVMFQREQKSREMKQFESKLVDVRSELKRIDSQLRRTESVLIRSSRVQDTKGELEETIKTITDLETENMEAFSLLETEEIKLKRLQKMSIEESKTKGQQQPPDTKRKNIQDLTNQLETETNNLNVTLDRVKFLQTQLNQTNLDIRKKREDAKTKLKELERSKSDIVLRLEEMKASRIKLEMDVRLKTFTHLLHRSNTVHTTDTNRGDENVKSQTSNHRRETSRGQTER